jgi:hypothetical protein
MWQLDKVPAFTFPIAELHTILKRAFCTRFFDESVVKKLQLKHMKTIIIESTSKDAVNHGINITKMVSIDPPIIRNAANIEDSLLDLADKDYALYNCKSKMHVFIITDFLGLTRSDLSLKSIHHRILKEELPENVLIIRIEPQHSETPTRHLILHL